MEILVYLRVFEWRVLESSLSEGLGIVEGL